MIEPIHPDLHCYIGADYFDTFRFTQKDQPTTYYDFTGWTAFEMKIGTVSLTEGNGLTIDYPSGSVSPKIARDQTITFPPGSTLYTLTVIDPNDKLGFLMTGRFEWVKP